jgi:hypothetical protein
MKLVRSFPANVPSGRSYVHDDLERLVMDRYDYRVLAGLDDDVVLIEWDVAVGREELDLFISRAMADPGRVRVAPYRLYQTTSGRQAPHFPIWAHRRYEGTPQTGYTRAVDTNEPTCHLFGFGLIYFPRRLIGEFLDWFVFPEARIHPFDDGSFSAWHYAHNPEREVPIDWDVPAVHLHYRLPKV